MSQYVLNAIQITKHLKESVPSATVIWGGVHATIAPDQCLEYADAVCVGEGELTVIELAEALEAKRSYADIQGLWTKTGTRKIRPLIQDLNSLPMPDNDYQSHYTCERNNIKKMTQEQYSEQIGNYIAMATRGCPFGCSYCANNAINRLYRGQSIFRARNPENLIRELEQAKATLPIKEILLDDDAFFMNSLDIIKEFADKYKQRVGIPLLVFGVAPTTLTKEKLEVLVDAGLVGTRMGIQSGSRRIRDLYKRNHSNEHLLRAADIMHQFYPKLSRIYFDLIVDNPWETDEDIKETLMFIANIRPPFSLILYSLEFYPGTDLRERAIREGLVDDSLESMCKSTYLSLKHTYFNRLLLLISASSSAGLHLTPRIMSHLIQHGVIGRFLYILFYIRSSGPRIKTVIMLTKEGLKCLFTGETTRILTYMLTRHTQRTVPTRKKEC